jgi:hypothetical protein
MLLHPARAESERRSGTFSLGESTTWCPCDHRTGAKRAFDTFLLSQLHLDDIQQQSQDPSCTPCMSTMSA